MSRFGAGIVALLVFVAAAFGVTVYVYRAQFDGPVSEAPAAWAQFGDYFGGVLNPIVGLAALGALLWTLALQNRELRLQREELGLQREELKNSIEELRRTAEAATEQSMTAKYQAEIMIRSARVTGLAGLLRQKHNLISKDSPYEINFPETREEVERITQDLESELSALEGSLPAAQADE